MSEKSSRRNVSAHTVLLFYYCIVSQNAADCISAHIHFKTFRGDMPPDPLRKLVAFVHLGLLPQTTNPR